MRRSSATLPPPPAPAAESAAPVSAASPAWREDFDGPEWQIVGALLSGRGWVREACRRAGLAPWEFASPACASLAAALLAETPAEEAMDAIPDREKPDTIDILDRANLYAGRPESAEALELCLSAGQFPLENVASFAARWWFAEDDYSEDAGRALLSDLRAVRAATWRRWCDAYDRARGVPAPAEAAGRLFADGEKEAKAK